MENTRHSHSTARQDSPASDDAAWSQNGVLEAVLAAIRECRPGKCVVLESRHLPEDRPGFAIAVE